MSANVPLTELVASNLAPTLLPILPYIQGAAIFLHRSFLTLVSEVVTGHVGPILSTGLWSLLDGW